MLRELIALLCILLWNLASAAQPALVNQMAGHASPYLAMHGDDPVRWQIWGKEALEKARLLNRPLLVSIGYFSCHWCHVMQRESYQDPQLANLLNEYFVPVKVDRELDPALDAHLIEFVELTRGQAGWPLNVILTPEGYPIVGTTYMPRDRFLEFLDYLQERWNNDPALLQDMANKAMNEWQQIRKAETGSEVAKTSTARTLLQQTMGFQDELAGGFGQQTKFPMVPQLRALLWIRAHQGDKSQDAFLRLTLDRMADQGLHDVLGGGFFRYVTDPDWQIPHFEKMLYDNAQLVVLYLQAAQQYRSSRYLHVGLNTLEFLFREMWRPAGYFVSSFSAVDEQGREGFYYLWDDDRLAGLLSADQLKAVRAAWLGTQAAQTEYGYLPRWQGSLDEISRELGWSDTRLKRVLASAREKMLKVRSGRSLLVDEKGLAAWNGLALSALAAGYAASGDARYRSGAEKLADHIARKFWDGEQLVRALDGEQVLAEATLEDYALVAQGLWDWSRQEGATDYRTLVAKMVRLAWQRYYRNNRWVQDNTPLIPMLDGRLALDESALPSATAVITRLSGQSEILNKDEEIQKKARAHLEQVRAHLSDSMFWYAGYVELLETDQESR